MQSLWLTYSGVSGGHVLTFKPTMLAALLASGVGTYLYLEPAGSLAPLVTENGRPDPNSAFKASFYGTALASEPQMPPRVVAAKADAGMELPALPLADAGLERTAFVAAMRLDQPARAVQGLRPQLSQASAAANPEPESVQLAPMEVERAAAVNPVPIAEPAIQPGLAARPVLSQPELDQGELVTQTGRAMAGTVRIPQVSPIARMAAAAASAVVREDLSGEAAKRAALAASGPPVPVGQSEPTALALAQAVPVPALENAGMAARTEAGLADSAPGQHLASPPALAEKTVTPLAQPQVQTRSEPIAALVPAAAPRVQPAAKPAEPVTAPPSARPAPIALQPIQFKLAPKGKEAAASDGPVTARRADRAGLAVKSRPLGQGLQKQTRLPDRVVGDFIFHQVSVRLNESPAGRIDVRIGGDASLSVRVGALLSVVEGRLDPDLFAALNRSAGADAYVSFRELRAAGIDVRYEPAGDTIVLAAD